MTPTGMPLRQKILMLISGLPSDQAGAGWDGHNRQRRAGENHAYLLLFSGAAEIYTAS
jgi:hypothetical protein